MRFARKVIYVSVGALLSVVAVLIFAYNSFISERLNYIDTAVHPYFKPVLIAQYKSYIFGSYWENEMINQAELMSDLSLTKRLEFFKGIVLFCDLDTSRAFIFVELVGKDALALSEGLEEFRLNKRYDELSNESKRRITVWADEFERIAGQ